MITNIVNDSYDFMGDLHCSALYVVVLMHSGLFLVERARIKSIRAAIFFLSFS